VSISGLLKTDDVFEATGVATVFVGVLFINLFVNANKECSATGLVENCFNDKMRSPLLENTRLSNEGLLNVNFLILLIGVHEKSNFHSIFHYFFFKVPKNCTSNFW
jgi:hypothetical protein